MSCTCYCSSSSASLPSLADIKSCLWGEEGRAGAPERERERDEREEEKDGECTLGEWGSARGL